MTEIASLDIVVDARTAEPAAISLEKLAQSSGRAESAGRKTAGAAEEMARAYRQAINPLDQVEHRVTAMGGALVSLDKRLKTAQMAGLNATRQFTDIGVSLASGAPPMMVLIQQLPQLADGFQMAKSQGVGMGDVFKTMIGGISPLVVGLGLLAGAAAVVGLGWARGRSSAMEYESAVTGVGRVAGLTSEELRSLSIASAEQGRISVAAAREQAAAYLATGQVAGSVLPRLIAIGKDYAATMGVDAAEATKQLAAAMGDPEKAANSLTSTMGLLTQAQIRQIEKMQEAGNVMGAQAVLLDGLEKAMQGQAAQVDQITSAWDAMGRSISNAVERFGEWLYVTKAEKLAEVERNIARVRMGQAAGDLGIMTARRDALQDEILQQRDLARVRAIDAQANQAAQRQWVAGEDARREAQQRAEQAAREAASASKRDAAAKLREYESLINGGERFRDGLRRQIETYGMAEIDVIRFNASLEAQRLVTQGNTADAVALAHQVLEAADAYTKLKVEMDKIVPPEQRTLTPFNIQTPNLELGPLNDIADAMKLIDDRARDAAFSMGDAFGEVGDSIGRALTALSGYSARIAEVNRKEAEYRETVRGKVADEKKLAEFGRERTIVEIQQFGDLAKAAKSMFGERTAGYRALAVAEQTFRAIEFALSAKATIMSAIETGQKSANSAIRAAAYGAEAVVNALRSLPFPFNIAAGAATAAAVAALGIKLLGGGGGGGGGFTTPTTNNGSGTTLGDPTAPSESLSRSMEIARRYQDQDLSLSRGMLTALEAIESNIGSLVTVLARQISGGAFGTDGLNLGTSTGGGFLGIGATTRTRELAGQGLDLTAGTLSQLIANGVSGSLYQLINNTKVKSGLFGIGGSTTTWTSETRSPMDAQLSRELGNILASLRQGVLAAAATLGLDGAEATLDSMVIALGRIDFTGLSSSEISQRLTQVFSSVGDQMALALLPQLEAFQRAGEGLFETMTRLATEVQTVNVGLASIGMTLSVTGIAGIEARSRLVELSGGLDDFLSGIDFFSQHFLTEAQRLAPVQAMVTAELARLGLAADLTREQFTSAVLGLDLTTEAGATMFASLMRLAPSFDLIASAAEDAAARLIEEARRAAEQAARIADQRRGLEISLMDAMGDTAGALAARRGLELAAMDETLRALQLQVWAAQDAATAQDALTRAQDAAAQSAQQYQQQLLQNVETARGALSQAYEREAGALQGVIDKFGGFSTSLRAFRDSLGVEAGGMTYARALAEFSRTASQARLGDETALGGLQGASQTYLDAARTNAGSAVEYALAVASVRNQLGLAADTADRQKSVAELQLDQLKALVSPLIDIDQSVISVHDAIVALHDAMRSAGLAPVSPAPMSAPAVYAAQAASANDNSSAMLEQMREMNARLERLEANTAQGAVSSNKTARILVKVTGEGGDALVTTPAAA